MTTSILTKPEFDLTEIINGEEYLAPSPFRQHQDITGNLYTKIRKYLTDYPIGKIYMSPLDVILEEDVNRVQPDLIFVKNENSKILQDWIRGVPDLVIEIVSKGSLSIDSIIKKDLYERYKIEEFWLVFPENKCIEIFSHNGEKYELFSASEKNDEFAESKIFPNLKIHQSEIF